MNAHNTPANYMATVPSPPANYGPSSPPASESRINKSYIISIRGLLKLACLVSDYFFSYPIADRLLF
jgi:hypothetical protein